MILSVFVLFLSACSSAGVTADQVDQALDRAEERIEELSNRISDLEDTVEYLRTDASDNSSNIDELDSRVNYVESFLSNVYN